MKLNLVSVKFDNRKQGKDKGFIQTGGSKNDQLMEIST